MSALGLCSEVGSGNPLSRHLMRNIPHQSPSEAGGNVGEIL